MKKKKLKCGLYDNLTRVELWLTGGAVAGDLPIERAVKGLESGRYLLASADAVRVNPEYHPIPKQKQKQEQQEQKREPFPTITVVLVLIVVLLGYIAIEYEYVLLTIFVFIGVPYTLLSLAWDEFKKSDTRSTISRPQREEQKKTQCGAEPHKGRPCRRCGGEGFLPQFFHVYGGICFDCDGEGYR